MSLVYETVRDKMFRRWSSCLPSEENKTLSYKNIMAAVPANEKLRVANNLPEEEEPNVSCAKKTYSHFFTYPDCDPGPCTLPKKSFYTLREVISNFQLPVTVNVVAGHEGNSEQSSLSSGERFTILAVTETESIKYRDDYSVRDLSLDYPFPVALTVSDDEETYVTADELRHCPYEYVSVNQAFEADNCLFRVGQVIKVKRSKEDRWSALQLLNRRYRMGVRCVKVPTGEKCFLPPDTHGYFRRALHPDVDGKEYLLRDALARFKLPFYVSFRITLRSRQQNMLSSELPINPVQVLEVYYARHVIVCHKTSEDKFYFGRLLVDTPVEVAVDTECEHVDTPSVEEIELAKQKLAQSDIFFEEPYQSINYSDLGIYRNEEPRPPIPPHIPVRAHTLDPALLRPQSRAVSTTATLPLNKLAEKQPSEDPEFLQSHTSSPSSLPLPKNVVVAQDETVISREISETGSASEPHLGKVVSEITLSTPLQQMQPLQPLSLVAQLPQPLLSREERPAAPMPKDTRISELQLENVRLLDANVVAELHQKPDASSPMHQDTRDPDTQQAYRPRSPKAVARARAGTGIPSEALSPVAPARTSTSPKARAVHGEQSDFVQQLVQEQSRLLPSASPLLPTQLQLTEEPPAGSASDLASQEEQVRKTESLSHAEDTTVESQQAQTSMLPKPGMRASEMPSVTQVPTAKPRPQTHVASSRQIIVAPSSTCKNTTEIRSHGVGAKSISSRSLTPVVPRRQPRSGSSLGTGSSSAVGKQRLPSLDECPEGSNLSNGPKSYKNFAYDLNLAIASKMANENSERVPLPPRRRSNAPKSKCQTVKILPEPVAPSAPLKSKTDVDKRCYAKLSSGEDKNPLLEDSVEDADVFRTFLPAYDKNQSLAYRSLEYPKQSDRYTEFSASFVKPFSEAPNNWTLIQI